MKVSKSCKILMFALLCIIFFITPKCFAEEHEYENLRYRIINTNEIEILGFVDSNMHTGVLEIPSEIDSMKVTTIGEYAFQRCDLSEGVIFPDTLTKIDKGAFIECQINGKLIISENVEEIGNVAFAWNYTLTRIEINNSSGIAEDAFDNRVGIVGEKNSYAETYALETGRIFIDISNVIYENGIGYKLDKENNVYKIVDYQDTENKVLEIPEKYNDISVTKIVDYAFSSSNLKEIIVPNSISELGIGVFSNMPDLEKVTLKLENLKIIPERTFYYSTKLGTIILPDTVEEIGREAFKCVWGNGIENFKLPPNIKIIEDQAFYCFNQKNSNGSIPILEIPESIEKIGSYAFYSTNIDTVNLPGKDFELEDSIFRESYITKINIPFGLKTIPESFLRRTCISELEIPNSVTTIEANAFNQIYSLTSISIPLSVAYIKEDVFYLCNSDLKVYGYKGSFIESYLKANDHCYYITFIGEETKTIFNVSVSTDYEITINGLKNSAGKIENIIIPETIHDIPVTRIMGGAFKNKDNISGTLSLPNTLKYIGNEAFYNCDELSGELVLPENIKKIGEKAFYGCKNLSGELFIPNSLEEIGGYSFYQCENLKSLHLSENIQKIGNYAFSNCGFEGTLVFPEAQIIWGNGAFSNCTSLTGEIIIPKYMKEIPYSMFSGCTNIEKITFLDNLETIGSYAFYQCYNLSGTLILPNSITAIESRAFSNCNFTSLKFSENIVSIGEAAFEYCSNLKCNLELPPNIKEIGNNAFYGCKNLSGELFIPSSLEKIGKCSFYQCENLKSLHLSENIQEIGNYAFFDCGFEGTLVFPETQIIWGDGVFSNCTSLTGEIIIPKYMEKIPDSMFQGCTNIEKITFLDSSNIVSIGKSAFKYCSNLKGELTLPTNLNEIGDSAFYSCGNLIGELKLPNSLEKIGQYAFWGCSFTTNINSQNQIKEISLEDLGFDIEKYRIQKITTQDFTTEKSEEEIVASKDIITIETVDGTPFARLNVVVHGDVNGDGKIRIYDAFQILKDVLVPGTNLSEIDIQIRDFNGDGQVRIYDAFQFLKKAILG